MVLCFRLRCWPHLSVVVLPVTIVTRHCVVVLQITIEGRHCGIVLQVTMLATPFRCCATGNDSDQALCCCASDYNRG